MLQQADKNANEAQIKQLAFDLLKLKNRETQTMKLNALGVKELKAGSGFKLVLEKLNIELPDVWISNITHNYSKDFHYMNLEVFL